MNKIGVLHPGEMGVSVAASAVNSGYQVYWMSQHRSDKTQACGAKYDLIQIDSLSRFCQTCETIITFVPLTPRKRLLHPCWKQDFAAYIWMKCYLAATHDQDRTAVGNE